MTRPQITLPCPVVSFAATPDAIVPSARSRTSRLPDAAGGVSRRSLIGGAIAALPLTGAPCGAAVAIVIDGAAHAAQATCVLTGLPSSDPDMAALGRRYAELDGAYLDAVGAFEDALSAIDSAVPSPRALVATEADVSLFGIAPSRIGSKYTDRDVEVLRAKPRRQNATGYFDRQTGELVDPDRARLMSEDQVIDAVYRPVWPAAQARAEEVIAARDRWDADWSAASKRVNADELEAALDEASAARRACAHLIASADAATLDAMLVRMRVLRDLCGDHEIAAGLLEGDGTDVLMINATIRDLIALLPPRAG